MWARDRLKVGIEKRVHQGRLSQASLTWTQTTERLDSILPSYKQEVLLHLNKLPVTVNNHAWVGASVSQPRWDKLRRTGRSCGWFIHLPIQRMLNTNPFCTLLFTSWSGRLSKPTCPDSFRVRIAASTYNESSGQWSNTSWRLRYIHTLTYCNWAYWARASDVYCLYCCTGAWGMFYLCYLFGNDFKQTVLQRISNRMNNAHSMMNNMYLH